MLSSTRRCTASSSAIKMLAAMAFPARYNYLSRIWALSPMAINVRLNLALPPSLLTRNVRLKTGFEQDDLALHIRPPQVSSPTQTNRHQTFGQAQDRQIAGMEPGRSLFWYRGAGNRTRPDKAGRRMRRV